MPLPILEHIRDFSYSKRSHFSLFSGYDFKAYANSRPDPETCDLKVYQDYLAFLFLKSNLPQAAKVLELGGGESRVLRHFAPDFECWNIDKCEGMGNGLKRVDALGYRMVYDYMGSFSSELPDSYFDCVFSISALEHTPEEQPLRESIHADIQRVLKPGGLSFHCLDVVFNRPFGHWINGIIAFLHANEKVLTEPPRPEVMLADPDCYTMSKLAFERGWTPIVGEAYEAFGKPASVNVCWRKESY